MTRIILRDGKVADLRPIQDNAVDREILKELFRHASAESLYFRFFHVVREVSEQIINSMVKGTGPNGLSMLCLSGDTALGVGSYSRLDDESAEVAFLVDDRLHGKGLGTLLLEHLAEAAWHYGFKRFEAYVLGENYKMLQVFEASGYEIQSQRDSNTVHLVLPLAETERRRALQETREKLATAASLHSFFQPQTVAVIGASRDSRRLGHVLLRHILDGGFQGTVYPVNPTAHSVSAVRAYPNVCEVPEPVDLAVIVVPASQVLPVVEDCIQAKVGAVIITSAGFSEAGAHGAELQQQVVQKLRGAGIRLIGPNCLGIINNSPDIRLNTSFAPRLPKPGKLAIASQSGGLGIAILEYADKMELGVSSFASMGNKADVSGNDLLQYWEDDADTQMVVLYLESFGNPRKFSRIARRVTQHKPILAVKGARTPAGASVSEARAAAHAAPDHAVDALFRQTGIIRVHALRDLFDVASLLSFCPLPEGRRVAVVTNTAGGAVMTADALLQEGLEFVEPVVDLGFETLAEMYRDVLPAVLRDPSVDSVVVIFIPVGLSDQDSASVSKAIAEAVAEVYRSIDNESGGPLPTRKPIVANFLMTNDYAPRYIDAGVQRIPVYPFPEQAVHALARFTEYAEYRRQPQGHIPDLDHVNSGMARALVKDAMTAAGAREEIPLPDLTVRQVLAAAGIAVEHPPLTRLQPSEISERFAVSVNPDPLFGPLMKLYRLHDIEDSSENRLKLGSRQGAVMQSMIRITPLTDLDAREMAEHVCGFAQQEIDQSCPQSIVELLLRISRLIDEVPEIIRLEIGEILVADTHYVLGESRISAGAYTD